MDALIVELYYHLDEHLKLFVKKRAHDLQMSDAEVLLVSVVAARYFAGNVETARSFLHQPRYLPKMLSKSRLSRRLHLLLPLLSSVFGSVGDLAKQGAASTGFTIDTYPVPVCQNIRIFRSKILKGAEYRGYCASKKSYFYGYKLVLVTTVQGALCEVALVPGSMHDRTAMDFLPLDFQRGSLIVADKAFVDAELEELWSESSDVFFAPERKKNAKAPDSSFFTFFASKWRKRIETVGSQIKGMWPYCLHAVTQAGFELKTLSFVLAYALQFLIKH